MSFRDYLRIFNNARKSAIYGGEDFSLTKKVHKEREEFLNKVDEGKLSKLSAGFFYFLGTIVGGINSFYVLAWYGVYKAHKEKKQKLKEDFSPVKKIEPFVFRNNLEKKVNELLEKFPDDYLI